MDTQLIEYFEAFERNNTSPKSPGRITQKKIADSGGLREADISKVFSFLRGKPAEPKPIQIKHVRECLEDNWRIDEKGFLVRSPKDPSTKKDKPIESHGYPTASPVNIYKDYRTANIGNAVCSGGKTVLVINTYLSNYIHNPEADEQDAGTIVNWLRQGKIIKVLILHPEQHAMQLRAKSLDIKGSELADRLIGDLTKLIGYMADYPEQLEVKLMDEIPGMSAVILEDKVIYGLHLSFGHTEKAHHIEMPKGTECKSYDNILKHFNRIWDDPNRAKPLTQQLLKNAENALYGIRTLQNSLIGTWDVFLHDLSDVLEGSGPAPFDAVVGSIIQWSLQISEPEKGVHLQSKLTMSGLETFNARLVIGHLEEKDYAHIRYTNFKNVTIHFSFPCRPDKPREPLLGYFLLNTGTDSCSGYIVLIKNTGKTPPLDKLPTYFRRLLSFRDGSYFSLARVQATRDKFRQGLDFAGTYRVYSYGGKKGGPKGIKINWLHIDDAGIARYKNQRFTKGDELIGRATYIQPNLHIMSTYYRRGVAERRSYLIAKVASNYPGKGRFYGAVHLGVSFESDQIPNGKRFILEYVEDVNFEDMEHEFLPVHSPEYNKVPDPIRGLLSGRVKNLNGFLRRNGLISDMQDLEKEWKESIDLGQVFCDSAVQHIRRREYAAAIDMLSRAVYHGFNALKDFENEVIKFDSDGLKVIQKMPKYQSICDILSQPPTT